MPNRQQARTDSDRARPYAGVAAVLVAGALAAGCGSSASTTKASAPAGAATPLSAPKSCTGSGPNRAGLVVEVSPSKVLTRCVSFSGASIPALSVLQGSHVELGTQKYSFGMAVCQVDNVPAHYSQCLPSGADYWALFLADADGAWTSPSVGVSQVAVKPGQWVGVRYDPPKGTPAPPPAVGRL